jgi:hypothetical protein
MKGFRGLELMILLYIYIYIYNLEMRIYLVTSIKMKFDMPIDTEEALVLVST